MNHTHINTGRPCLGPPPSFNGYWSLTGNLITAEKGTGLWPPYSTMPLAQYNGCYNAPIGYANLLVYHLGLAHSVPVLITLFVHRPITLIVPRLNTLFAHRLPSPDLADPCYIHS